ncbi:hypothetical protein OEZ86_004329 [Tetradesmus obliquus]|nr:hypothetical protein OEZ86_004329 [Tetradesmus obliquus]
MPDAADGADQPAKTWTGICGQARLDAAQATDFAEHLTSSGLTAPEFALSLSISTLESGKDQLRQLLEPCPAWQNLLQPARDIKLGNMFKAVLEVFPQAAAATPQRGRDAFFDN